MRQNFPAPDPTSRTLEVESTRRRSIARTATANGVQWRAEKRRMSGAKQRRELRTQRPRRA